MKHNASSISRLLHGGRTADLVIAGNSLQIGNVSYSCQTRTEFARYSRAQRVLVGGMLFLLCISVGFGAPVTQDDYLIDSWTRDEGLPSSSVTAIAQTPEGYLWIGTLNGLARFDGVRFVNFDPFNTPELKQARVRRLFVDGNGTLWISTFDNSLTSWRNGVFAHESVVQEFVKVFTRSNEVLFVTLYGEVLSRRGLTEQPGHWSSFGKPKERIRGWAFNEDRAGELWYYTRNGAVGRIKGTNSEIVPSSGALEGALVKCMDIDREGRVRVGSDKGVAVWDGEGFQNQTPTNGEPSLAVSFITCLADGSCWVMGGGKVRRMIDRSFVCRVQSKAGPRRALPEWQEKSFCRRSCACLRNGSYGRPTMPNAAGARHRGEPFLKANGLQGAPFCIGFPIQIHDELSCGCTPWPLFQHDFRQVDKRPWKLVECPYLGLHLRST